MHFLPLAHVEMCGSRGRSRRGRADGFGTQTQAVYCLRDVRWLAARLLEALYYCTELDWARLVKVVPFALFRGTFREGRAERDGTC